MAATKAKKKTVAQIAKLLQACDDGYKMDVGEAVHSVDVVLDEGRRIPKGGDIEVAFRLVLRVAREVWAQR